MLSRIIINFFLPNILTIQSHWRTSGANGIFFSSNSFIPNKTSQSVPIYHYLHDKCTEEFLFLFTKFCPLELNHGMLHPANRINVTPSVFQLYVGFPLGQMFRRDLLAKETPNWILPYKNFSLFMLSTNSFFPYLHNPH